MILESYSMDDTIDLSGPVMDVDKIEDGEEYEVDHEADRLPRRGRRRRALVARSR